MFGIGAMVERVHFLVTQACIKAASFHEVVTGVQAQREKPMLCSEHLKLVHEASPEPASASHWNDEEARHLTDSVR